MIKAGSIRVGWYKITKTYRNNEQIWRVYISKKTSEDFCDEKDLLSSIGEETDGGHNYGYKMESRYYGKKKPKNTDLLLRKPRISRFWETRRERKRDLHFLI